MVFAGVGHPVGEDQGRHHDMEPMIGHLKQTLQVVKMSKHKMVYQSDDQDLGGYKSGGRLKILIFAVWLFPAGSKHEGRDKPIGPNRKITHQIPKGLIKRLAGLQAGLSADCELQCEHCQSKKADPQSQRISQGSPR